MTDPAPQYYVIRVIGSGITSGSVAYKLKVTFMPEDFVNSHDPGEMGNNDSFSGARYISRATSGDNINYTAQEATLDFRNDYDAYRISLDSGHKFTAILKSPLEHGNYYYVLLDSSYKEVQDNLYNGQDQTGAACYELMYNVPLTGTYYLLVFSDENKYYDVFNKYKLEFYSSKNNEAMEYNSSVKNFNNAWEFASSISLNTAYTCKLDSPFDCDVYSISIPSEGKLTVNLDKKDFGDNYSLMVKDLDSTIYEYINSKTDYVFYAQRSGTYKLAVIRRNLQSPSSLDYALAAAFTPKSGFDTYENTSTVTPVKNVDFLKSNNQYLRVNGSSTNLTDISNQQARSLNMDNRYDVDWFKIDTSKTGSGQNSAKISLTGIPAGDDYNLVVVDSAGNVIGSSNKTSNQSEALNFMINKAANSYYYVCVYANTYGASTHSASLSFSTVAESTAVYVSDIGIQNTGEEYLEDLAAEAGATLSGNTVYYMNRSITYGSSNSRVVNGKLVVNAYDFEAYFVDKNAIRQQLIALDPGLFDGDIGIAAVNDIIQVAVLYEKSENVRNIQRLLQKLGCWVDKNGNRSKANATGYYGETTQASLIKFQKEYMSKNDQSVIRQSVTREMAQLLSVNYSITFGIENAYQNSSSIKTAKDNLARLGYGGKLKSYYYDPAVGKTVYGYSGQWSYDFNDALWNFTTDYGYKNTYINNGFNKAVLYKWIQDAADRIGNSVKSTYGGKSISLIQPPTNESSDSDTPAGYNKPVALTIGEEDIESARLYNGEAIANLADLAFGIGSTIVGRPGIDSSFEIQYRRPDGGLGIKVYTNSDLLINSDGRTYSMPVIKFANDLQYGNRLTVVKHSDGSQVIHIDKEDGREMFNSISSVTIGSIPGVGDAKDWQEVITGYDIITGEKLSVGERCLTLGCAFLPIINGSMVRVGKKGVSKVDNILEAADKISDVEKAAFRASLWKLKPTIRGLLIEMELARTEYNLTSTGWYHIGAEMNGYFPVIDFWKGNNVVSLKTIDPRLYSGNGVTNKLLDYIEDLKTVILVDGQRIANANKKLDIRVPVGTKSKINLQELMAEAEGIIIEVKEF